MEQSFSLDRLPLRERKKLKTRIAIQEHALRLFTEQGYDATTVEQIAEAAEVSPSTFFRYFPTKEDAVLSDEYDPLIADAFRALPTDTDPVAGLRTVFDDFLSGMDENDKERMLARLKLTHSVPALRARSWDAGPAGTAGIIREVLAERLGRDTDDFEIEVFTGALLGAVQGVLAEWLRDGGTRDIAAQVRRMFDFLQAGMPLSPRP
ncbi:TetR family transcriptional regulator [Actinocorallia herbida]|uniref:TetR family transcriptional regulator n=1 Tax=Actinocorallia herbida TaxID=58109 RepID=A0A3N1CNQ7_9ACTN|nr:TetR family transcriptional regulator [Actinocorallia herbida]ROO82804.1 TetR family transcriptional regulator [Actinocorallia herbida]